MTSSHNALMLFWKAQHQLTKKPKPQTQTHNETNSPQSPYKKKKKKGGCGEEVTYLS